MGYNYKNRLTDLHHVIEHEAGMFILVLLCQMYKAVLFVKGDGRKVGVHGDVAEFRNRNRKRVRRSLQYGRASLFHLIIHKR